jgi:hypothetical protein
VNTADQGLIVNGQNVTAYGLFVEHYQKYEVTWNGNGGRTYFFQNEMPYDPPNQATWRTGANGYAAYKVADGVTSHEGWGLGSYCFFNVNPAIHADRGFEVPVTAGVRFHDLLTVSLGGTGTIDHVINNTGVAAQARRPSRSTSSASRNSVRPGPGGQDRPGRASNRSYATTLSGGPSSSASIRSSWASVTQPCQVISLSCGCTGPSWRSSYTADHQLPYVGSR